MTALCQCGCGLPAPLARQTETKRGYVKGQPVRFRVGHRVSVSSRYRSRTVNGVCMPEHVLIAERALGRPMPPGVEIHHVDENKRNNRPGNLVICQDATYHRLLHVRTKVLRAGGDPNTQALCHSCREPKDFNQFWRTTARLCTGLAGRCKDCSRARDRVRIRKRDRDRSAA